MQIALTKKLTDALGVKLPTTDETINPLFTWTANWTKVWDNRRAEDMLVLVNNATRFTVAIYQVKRKDLKNVEKMMQAAIVNTLLSMNLNTELVNEYGKLASYDNPIENPQVIELLHQLGFDTVSDLLDRDNIFIRDF